MSSLAVQRGTDPPRLEAPPPASPVPDPARNSRRAEIDLLRVVAMLAVFAVHAAEPFNPWDEWHVRSPERSKWLGEVILFLAPWVMPLFVLLAGAGAWHSLGIRSARAFGSGARGDAR